MAMREERRGAAAGRGVFLTLSLLTLLPLAGSVLLGQGRAESSQEDSLYRYLSVFTEVFGLVRDAYVEETSVDALMRGALDGVTDALDPFATFVPAEATADFAAARAVGAGHSGLIVAKRQGVVFVVSVLPGSPAADAELESGDLISELQGLSTREMPLWRVEVVLAGDPGTEVRMEIFRRGERMERAFTLAEFPAPRPAIEHAEAPLLRVPRIGPETRDEVAALLRELKAQGAAGLVIDLRGVAGGDPEAAYRLASLYATGELGRLTAGGETVRRFDGSGTPLWSDPVVVLVDGGTADAAEVLAAVLSESAGAELVGMTTFGHAGRRSVVTLSDGSQLVVTSGAYTGPDGKPMHDGLEPDLEVQPGDRSFAEKDLTLDEIILRRGIERLRQLQRRPFAA